ncbi:MAG TPA: class I SAM-dependent methyltransferase [Pseudomonadales bacterium]|nr:class I SAM-dependent methyltransferase [Pseudomonadales bacterium]
MSDRIGSVALDDSLSAGLRASLAAAAGATPSADDARFLLLAEAEGLALRSLADPSLGSLCVELLHGRTGWRSGVRARGERLVRACGVARAESPPRVVDGTGGLGVDAWLLACAGASVQVIEQHPVLAALLVDGLARAAHAQPDTCARIRVRTGDTRALLDSLGADVLYLDPMYPPRRKAALGDRRLRLVAALLTADGRAGDDAAGLVRAGIAARIPRVVLKRPVQAQVEVDSAPNHSLEGRTTRFDVWITPR